MPGEIAQLSGAMSFIAGCCFLVVVGIMVRRFWQTRLWMTLIRASHFLLFAIICWAWPPGFLAPGPEIALRWYQCIVFLFPCTEVLQVLYLNFVIYGQTREQVAGFALLLAGVNCTMVFFPENLSVIFAVDLQVYYMSLSPAFIVTNLLLGSFHVLVNARANLMVIHRPDVLRRNKGKFLLFTAGTSVMYAGFVAIMLGGMLFADGSFYAWLAVICVLGLACTLYGLLYANSGVFQLPIRIYLLVVFGAGGEVLYEKWFSKQASETALLLPPAAASIAGLVDGVFCRSRQACLLSLQQRQVLYEWRNNTGAMLVTDHDSGIFRNSLRLLLQHTDKLPGDRQEFGKRVEQVFNYYPIEQEHPD